MPHAPAHPCNYPGCPTLTHDRFCETHAVLYSRHYEKYSRDPEKSKRYGRAWQVIRRRYLAAHPLCEECKHAGRLTPATEVHHKKPLRAGGTNDFMNLAALCHPCHSAITIQESRSYPLEWKRQI